MGGKHAAQTDRWGARFRQAMGASRSKASEDAAYWQKRLHDTASKDQQQRLDWARQQSQKFRTRERKAQQWKEWDFQKWARKLRRLGEEALKKERELEQEWADKLL